MSTKMLGVVGRGSGRQNSIPTIPTIPTVPTIPTIPTIPTPWGCSKLKPPLFIGEFTKDIEYGKKDQSLISRSMFDYDCLVRSVILLTISLCLHVVSTILSVNSI